MTPITPPDILALNEFLALSGITAGSVIARITAFLPSAIATLSGQDSWPAWVSRDTGPIVRQLIEKSIVHYTIDRMRKRFIDGVFAARTLLNDSILTVKPRFNRDPSLPFDLPAIVNQYVRDDLPENAFLKTVLYHNVVNYALSDSNYPLATYVASASDPTHFIYDFQSHVLRMAARQGPEQVNTVVKIMVQVGRDRNNPVKRTNIGGQILNTYQHLHMHAAAANFAQCLKED